MQGRSVTSAGIAGWSPLLLRRWMRGVRFGGFFHVVRGERMVTVRMLRTLSRLIMLAGSVVGCRLLVMTGGFLVMFGCAAMVLHRGMLLSHERSLLHDALPVCGGYSSAAPLTGMLTTFADRALLHNPLPRYSRCC